ncbi:protein of unknown function [Burkholderia multivorans]
MLSKGAQEMMAWCAAGCPLPDDAPKPSKPAKRPPDAANDLRDIPADEVDQMRAELVAMLQELARIEDWPVSFLREIIAAGIKQPVDGLIGDIDYFRNRLTAARATLATGGIDDRH